MKLPLLSRALPVLAVALGSLLLCSVRAFAAGVEVPILPPEPNREFRGGWVASVGNIDWPSRSGLPSAVQQQEWINIVNLAVQMKLNALVLQVRPACDAIYKSEYEPWSEYLTGQMGKAPSPYYDPLEFAVKEAHKRGIELHAWFNPYRAKFLNDKTPIDKQHVSKTHPELVRRYGKFLWMDPGEPGTREYVIKVIMDVVKHYDIDGVHFDDYFYPYKEVDAKGKEMDFPDDQSWQAYQAGGGKLKRNDWRRDSVNVFIRDLNTAIKAEKPWVKFGISPFGIWKPGYPQGISGLNAYEVLYADSRKWFSEGMVDYFVPQLYWNIEQKAQSFPVLLDWWAKQNDSQRHLWIGISTARVGSSRGAAEIINQIEIMHQQPATTGHIHWNFKSLQRNRDGIQDLLIKNVYTNDVLIPASPWLSTNAPGKPFLAARDHKEDTTLRWRTASSDKVWLWALQMRVKGQWQLLVLPGEERSFKMQTNAPETAPDYVALRAVNRYGLISEPAVLEVKAKE